MPEEGPLATEAGEIQGAQRWELLGDGEVMDFPQGLGRGSLMGQGR